MHVGIPEREVGDGKLTVAMMQGRQDPRPHIDIVSLVDRVQPPCDVDPRLQQPLIEVGLVRQVGDPRRLIEARLFDSGSGAAGLACGTSAADPCHQLGVCHIVGATVDFWHPRILPVRRPYHGPSLCSHDALYDLVRSCQPFPAKHTLRIVQHRGQRAEEDEVRVDDRNHVSLRPRLPIPSIEPVHLVDHRRGPVVKLRHECNLELLWEAQVAVALLQVVPPLGGAARQDLRDRPSLPHILRGVEHQLGLPCVMWPAVGYERDMHFVGLPAQPLLH
mmetsp:Transcript_5479/g.15953  ORF Transcript_5479/g.15953 Transcript_5479/m.15953 type:complete len:276 (+) Transcript_5479:482-1309(+)